MTETQKTNSDNSRQGKVIAVFSTVGGIGKTTIAVNLAAALAEMQGEKVCIIDADLQFGDVCRFLDVKPSETIAAFAGQGLTAGKQVTEFLTGWREKLDILAAPIEIEQAEAITAAIIEAAIRELGHSYSYIIIDTAIGFSDVVLTVLDCANTVLLVGGLDSIPTVKNLKTGLDTLKNLGYGEDKVKLILNRDKAKTFMDVQEVERLLGCRFTSFLLNDFKTAVEAVNSRVPFVIGQPDRELARQVVSLARQLTE